MTVTKIVNGGWFVGRRNSIMGGCGILAAIAAYLVGDSDVFAMMQAIFTLGGIYFLRKSQETKGK